VRAKGAWLLVEWMKEGMAEHGWYWSQSAPEDAPPPPPVPVPVAEQAERLVEEGLAGEVPEVERLQRERDALRGRLEAAPAEERDRLRGAIRELGGAVAEVLAASDATAEALRAEAPRPAPGPLSPEAEQRVLDLYRRLGEEQNGDQPET
jgi:hypothetical protein